MHDVKLDFFTGIYINETIKSMTVTSQWWL